MAETQNAGPGQRCDGVLAPASFSVLTCVPPRSVRLLLPFALGHVLGAAAVPGPQSRDGSMSRTGAGAGARVRPPGQTQAETNVATRSEDVGSRGKRIRRGAEGLQVVREVATSHPRLNLQPQSTWEPQHPGQQRQ